MVPVKFKFEYDEKTASYGQVAQNIMLALMYLKRDRLWSAERGFSFISNGSMFSDKKKLVYRELLDKKLVYIKWNCPRLTFRGMWIANCIKNGTIKLEISFIAFNGLIIKRK
jgi:hypothetical protein